MYRYMCVIGDNTGDRGEAACPSWRVRGVVRAISQHHGNDALMQDAMRTLVCIAWNPDYGRLVEGEDMKAAIPLLTAAFRGTLERIHDGVYEAADSEQYPSFLLWEAAKTDDVAVARAFTQAGTTAMALDLLKGVHDEDLWEATNFPFVCISHAAGILATVCLLLEKHDDVSSLKKLVDAGAVDAVIRKGTRMQLPYLFSPVLMRPFHKLHRNTGCPTVQENVGEGKLG
jgi:hypothetical protein